MAIELATNGSIVLKGDDAIERIAAERNLSTKERKYVERLGAEIGMLTAAEQKLIQKAKDLEAEVKASTAAQQLKAVRDRLKQVREERHERSLRVDGVIESKMEDDISARPIEDSIGDLIDLKPKAVNGRKPKQLGGRR